MKPHVRAVITVLIGVLLASSLFQHPVFADNPKVGSACKKAGMSQKGDGVVYICKKSGNELVWTIALGVKYVKDSLCRCPWNSKSNYCGIG